MAQASSGNNAATASADPTATDSERSPHSCRRSATTSHSTAATAAAAKRHERGPYNERHGFPRADDMHRLDGRTEHQRWGRLERAVREFVHCPWIGNQDYTGRVCENSR